MDLVGLPWARQDAAPGISDEKWLSARPVRTSPKTRVETARTSRRLSPNLLRCRMPWTDSFWKPIKLNDGRTLTTLDDARELISTLPPTAQVAERWLDAEEMLVRAEATPSASDDALTAVVRALKAEGLI
jgi:hypothetical protein